MRFTASTMLLSAVALMLAASAALADPATVAPVPADPLIGKWRVDLTASPAEGKSGRYYTEMEITSVDGNRIVGTFYGSPMEKGRINRSWGSVRFAFITHDGGGGAYNHSGEFVDGRLIRGLSHAVDRDFLSVWTAQPGTIEKPAY